jgi:CheY-like chemotaxis protein
MAGMGHGSRLRGVSPSGPFIAVVDDEPAVLKALERLLRSAKYEVAAFGSGDAFLASLATRKPDCVILDLHMPAMNGFEVQARLTSDSAAVPVIVMTAHDTATSQQRALAGGAAAYLRKPIDAPLLLGAIRAAIVQPAS